GCVRHRPPGAPGLDGGCGPAPGRNAQGGADHAVPHVVFGVTLAADDSPGPGGEPCPAVAPPWHHPGRKLPGWPTERYKPPPARLILPSPSKEVRRCPTASRLS